MYFGKWPSLPLSRHIIFLKSDIRILLNSGINYNLLGSKIKVLLYTVQKQGFRNESPGSRPRFSDIHNAFWATYSL